MSAKQIVVLLGLVIGILVLPGCATTSGSKEVANVPLDVATYDKPEEVWQAVSICKPEKGTVAFMTSPVSKKWIDREFAQRTLYVPHGNTTVTGRRESSRALVCDRRVSQCKEHSAILVDNRYAILGKRKELLGRNVVIIAGDAKSILFLDGSEVLLEKSIFSKSKFSTDPLRVIFDNRDHTSQLSSNMIASARKWRRMQRAIDVKFSKGQAAGEMIGGCNRLATSKVVPLAGVSNLGDFKERFSGSGGLVLSSNDALSGGWTAAARIGIATAKGFGGNSVGLHAKREVPKIDIYEH